MNKISIFDWECLTENDWDELVIANFLSAGEHT